jgi:SAM-dependent methyltransferase
MAQLFSNTHRLDLLEQRLRQRPLAEVPASVVALPCPTRAPAPEVRRDHWRQAVKSWQAQRFAPGWIFARLPGFRRLTRWIQSLNRLDAYFQDVSVLRHQLEAQQAELEAQQAELEAHRRRLQVQEHEFQFLKRDLELVFGARATTQSHTQSQPAPALASAPAEPDWLTSYARQYLASPAEARERLRLYLPDITTVIPDPTNGQILDLGCGDGDWIATLGEQGFRARGIDSEPQRIQRARARGLRVALAASPVDLSEVDSASIAVLSLLRQIEMLSLHALPPLLNEAFRVLRPGGLLIIETLNPQDNTRACASYWRNPRHRQLVPASLLHLLVGQAGFHGRTLHRLPARPHPPDVAMLETTTPVAPGRRGADSCYALLARRPVS